ncbi:tetratricopeptide repeat protein [Archangium sp.]|uniref:tetratricopeptide repeat protein n=1 Tax=Archangium sp. TaxID=1872627 RepID=UPI00286A3276|nr:tetratricopeptide repeat protein [Archangium sp.]
MVILAAITLEYQAVLQVETGAWEGSQWEEQKGPNGLPVAFRTFHGKGERPLRVAVAQAGDMGGVAATNALLPLVAAYHPRCVAMCGVCAGRPKKTNLGDVIAAERLFFHDTGKRLPDEVQQDLKTYNLRDDWKVALEHCDFAARFRDETWWKARPVPYEWQENWVLTKLRERVEDPSSLPECHEYCPQWEKVIASLWESKHVEDGTLTLSEEGRKRIGRILIQHRNRFPDTSPTGTLLPFKVHVAPMGSGNQVVEDEDVWSFVSDHMRKTLGLEMEAAAIGALAHAQRDRKLDALVMKGVMDFANHGRDDQFKEFAARASAECLIAFLREHLDVEVVPEIDDILVPGIEEKLPENAPPSALLNARYEVVPFHRQGRETILAELERWCDEGPSVAVRLIHAEGGAGKTRLAIEWIHQHRKPKGWVAGFLPKDIPGDWFDRLWSRGQPVLVVIDYAESRSDLREILQRVHRYSEQERAGVLRRMRFLLLARNSGDWWQSLKQSDSGLSALLDATPPRELPPLAIEKVEREKVFHEAAEKFAEKRGKTYVKRASIPLSDEHFERVLYLHMAALASVDGLAFEANTLMDVILDHEEHFWEIRARQTDVALALQRSLARQVVVAATLRGGFADSSDASTVAGRLLERALSDNEQELLRLLHRIYQRTDNDSAVFLPALEPDLIGEGMVLRVASPTTAEDRLPSAWIDRVCPPDEEARVVSTGMEVLGRASATQPSMVRPWLERLLAGPLLPSRALLALQAAKAIGLRTAFSALGDVLADRLESDGDVRLARELEAAGIPGVTVSLGRVAEWTGRALLRALPPSAKERELDQRSKLLNNQGVRLGELGRREEALEAMREAVDIRRSLAQHNSEAFRPDLAGSLSNLGAMFRGLGRREEALEVTHESVGLYRALVHRNFDAFRPSLAGSLNNLGTILGELGRRDEALAAIREAVEVYRALAQRNPDVFRPDLAMVLNNLGNRLSELGLREEALEATREAVDIRRSLAQRKPDAFQPNLAMGLNNLGNRLGELGRREEALDAMREAVAVCRALVQRNPDAFRPSLAMGLNNLGVLLSGMGRREEALEATREAVDIRRSLAQRNPDAFRPDLASCLNNLGAMLSELSRREEALEATREAAAVSSALAQQNPEAFQPTLASCLHNLGNRLSEMGHREEALVAATEAVDIRRALAQQNPEAFQPDLASSLNSLGNRLSEMGRQEEALKATREAIQLYEFLVPRNPDVFQPSLANSLNNLGGVLRQLGRHEEALEFVREAVDIRRALAQRNPEVFRPSLAMDFSNLGIKLAELGRREEALSAMEEAIETLWPFFERFPNAFARNASVVLSNLRLLHQSLQRPLSPVLEERIATFERLMR